MKNMFALFLEEVVQLDEKLIVFNGGKRTGQVVFMAGGSGSGKGFAIENFMDDIKFKRFDVDRYKDLYLKFQKRTHSIPELEGLNLRDPKDVEFLHHFVRKRGTSDTYLQNFAKNIRPELGLPNIIFDITLKSESDVAELMPYLNTLGYESQNIHILWMLTEFGIAKGQNADRKRVVPYDILFGTHDGAANTMKGFLERGRLPTGVDGEFKVVIRPSKDKRFQVIRGITTTLPDFTYFTFKRAGRSMDAKAIIQSKIMDWIEKLRPKESDRPQKA